jgi:hypothetical protein
MKRFQNVETINLGTERDFYTKHGQHLNTTERMSMEIASTIQSTGEKMELISVKWKNDRVSNIEEHLASQGKANVNPEGEDSEGTSKLRVTDIPKAEDYSQK